MECMWSEFYKGIPGKGLSDRRWKERERERRGSREGRRGRRVGGREEKAEGEEKTHLCKHTRVHTPRPLTIGAWPLRYARKSLYATKLLSTWRFFSKLYLIRGNHTKNYLTFSAEDSRITNNHLEKYVYVQMLHLLRNLLLLPQFTHGIHAGSTTHPRLQCSNSYWII